MTDDDDGENRLPTRPGPGDAVHTIARTLLGVLPLVGGPATELLNAAVAPPLARRRDDFVNDVAERLLALENAGLLRIGQLGTNEAFLDVLLRGTQAALRTSNREKRVALRNAVLNAALPSPPDEAWQHIFLGMIEGFTDWHVRFLKFASDPAAWLRRAQIPAPSPAGGGPNQVGLLQLAFPSLVADELLLAHVWREMLALELLNSELSSPTYNDEGIISPRISTRGAQLLAFIEEPVV